MFGYIQLEIIEAFMHGVKDRKQYMVTAMCSNYVVLAAALLTILFVKNDAKKDKPELERMSEDEKESEMAKINM